MTALMHSFRRVEGRPVAALRWPLRLAIARLLHEHWREDRTLGRRVSCPLGEEFLSMANFRGRHVGGQTLRRLQAQSLVGRHQ